VIVPSLFGALAVTTTALLRLLKGKPKDSEELEAFALALVLAFIDAFMLAYIVPFYPGFASKLTFHVFVYTLLASLTAVLYASYRALTDLKVYAVAMTPWFYILLLILFSRILRSIVIFIW
jgi:hypothetical protein